MAAKQKVLYLITKSNWGGAQRYVYDLATRLDPEQFDVVVACGGNGILVDMLTHANIRTITINALTRDVSLRHEWRFTRELWSIIRQEKPTILHVNSSKAGGLGALLGRITSVPRIVFTAHGWAFNEDRPWWQRIIIKLLHWTTVLLSHRTIAVSHAILQQMNWPGVQRKMKVVYPGRTIGPMYSPNEARDALVQLFPYLEPIRNATWITCIAELHPIKRHKVLFAAIDEVRKTNPDVRLLCIGEGDERDALQHYITQHNLNEHVYLLGNVPEAARFLRAFALKVLVSHSESYGYVLHEAGLAEIPVIATRVGGVPDIVSHETSGLLVPPNDTRATTAAIQRLLSEPDTAKTFAHALHNVMKKRTSTRMAEATAALYTL
jgi:glycosyltransferase involved in cell wall biosynthesis